VTAKLRGWASKRPLITAAIALVIGAGLGVASYTSTVDELRNENAALEEDLASLEEERDGLGDEVSTAEAAADEAAANAQEEIAAAQEEASETLAKLDKREQQLHKRERELDKRAKQVNQAERRLEQSTFSDGIWQVGSDIQPGTYRAPGGSSCYWALLGSADTQDIINNGGFAPNQTLAIDSPWFESTNCGEWKRI
jgi:predicted nuclease with TOPRIM domain